MTGTLSLSVPPASRWRRLRDPECGRWRASRRFAGSGVGEGRGELDRSGRRSCLPAAVRVPHAAGMFVVTEAEATAIRAVFEQQGELSAAVELRRLFPGITDNAQARECARIIAGWEPLPGAPHPVRRLHQGRGGKP